MSQQKRPQKDYEPTETTSKPLVLVPQTSCVLYLGIYEGLCITGTRTGMEILQKFRAATRMLYPYPYPYPHPHPHPVIVQAIGHTSTTPGVVARAYRTYTSK